MEQKKDCSLLRPFDLGEAKAGNRIAWYINGDEGDLVAGPDIDGRICIDWEGKRRGDRGLVVYDAILDAKYLRIAPLCWVEGRPVYPGDNLYLKNGCGVFTAGGRMVGVELNSLTWSKPKRTVKKAGWINIYPLVGECGQAGAIYPTKTAADNSASSARIACTRVEWEEMTP